MHQVLCCGAGTWGDWAVRSHSSIVEDKFRCSDGFLCFPFYSVWDLPRGYCFPHLRWAFLLQLNPSKRKPHRYTLGSVQWFQIQSYLKPIWTISITHPPFFFWSQLLNSGEVCIFPVIKPHNRIPGLVIACILVDITISLWITLLSFWKGFSLFHAHHTW